MTVIGKHPGLDGLTIDNSGNVYVTEEGIIWKSAKKAAKEPRGVKSPLLKPIRTPPPVGANGLTFHNEQTALFVSLGC